MPEKEKVINNGLWTSTSMCTKLAGRPNDNEQIACDRMCAYSGFATGNCGSKVGSIVDLIITGAEIIAKIPVSTSSLVSKACRCTNDLRDATCGPDGRFLGISCPFDSSACNRKCCREGKRGGKCGGFLRYKCKCG